MPRNFSQSSSEFLASIHAEIERLQSLREQVAAAFNPDRAVTKITKTVRKGMTEEGRRKIAAAQKARWAKQKKTNKTATKASTRKAAVKQAAKKAVAKRAGKKRKVTKAAPARTTD